MSVPNVKPPKPDLADLIAARQRELKPLYPKRDWRDVVESWLRTSDLETIALAGIVSAFPLACIGAAITLYIVGPK
ncbi:MAG: hypothetical protein V4458_06205 [Pseudomonadota bacterium]